MARGNMCKKEKDCEVNLAQFVFTPISARYLLRPSFVSFMGPETGICAFPRLYL